MADPPIEAFPLHASPRNADGAASNRVFQRNVVSVQKRRGVLVGSEWVFAPIQTAEHHRSTGADDVRSMVQANPRPTGTNSVSECLSLLDLRAADFTAENFICANLQGSNLEGCFGVSAIFGQANLEGINLAKAFFIKADFRNAKLVGANLEGARLLLANLEKANLEGTNLQGAK
jgi:uncharacterized protein YjbI with pentapeptide repeats